MARPLAEALRGLPARFWATSTINRVAVAACALWAVLVLSYAAGYFGAEGRARGTAFLDAVFFLVALVLPMGLAVLAAWLAAELARQRDTVAALVEATEPLVAALGETRAALADEGPVSPRDLERAVRAAMASAEPGLARGVAASLVAPLEEVRAGQRALGERVAALAEARAAERPAPAPDPEPREAARPEPRPSRRERKEPARRPEPDPQPALPMMAGEPEEALDHATLIRALDFPRDAEDRDGFQALKRALRHHSLAQMLQAAEDVMNLLSQEGVYMDDLRHDPAPPEAWRAFVAGRRGGEVDAVGGVRDERALEVVRGLMKSDPIFRDTSLFFQRRFDVVLGEFARDADDATLLAIADTRSGRAFMLCARVSGSFG